MIKTFNIIKTSKYHHHHTLIFRSVHHHHHKIIIIKTSTSSSSKHQHDPSFRNYGINMSVVLRRSFMLELRDLGLYGVTNDPSFRNYGINTFVELRRSFLLELRDQVFMELLTILPFGITGFRSLRSC